MKVPVAKRRRSQPWSSDAVVHALMNPTRPVDQAWFAPGQGERDPVPIRVDDHAVEWSSIWREHPLAEIHFLAEPADAQTRLTWELFLPEPLPAGEELDRMSHRLTELINWQMGHLLDTNHHSS